jgi:Tfp pilus assembly protein PilE
MIPYHSQRGFTLLIAVILASVALALGLALVDIAYKQTVLSSTSRQSQSAFYNADAALECALYYDQQKDFFGGNPFNLVNADVTCNELPVTFSVVRSGTAPIESVFTIPCEGGGTSASVTVWKNNDGDDENVLYVTGFNTCDSTNQRRIERGLKVTY